jgi:hypothetical protein
VTTVGERAGHATFHRTNKRERPALELDTAGEIVTTDQLTQRIWPGVIVSQNTIQVHTVAVRKALGPYRSLLKTESGRGYRLLGDWIVQRHDTAKPPVGAQRMRVDIDSPVTSSSKRRSPRICRPMAPIAWRPLLRSGLIASRATCSGLRGTSAFPTRRWWCSCAFG